MLVGPGYTRHVFQPGAVRFGGREVCCGAHAVEVHWGSFPRLRDRFRFVGRLELSRRDALSYLRCLARCLTGDCYASKTPSLLREDLRGETVRRDCD